MFYFKMTCFFALCVAIAGCASNRQDACRGPASDDLCKTALQPNGIDSELFAIDHQASKLSQLDELQNAFSESVGLSEKKFGTTIYYVPQANPLLDFPELDRGAKAVVIALGGAGLETASGQTFMQDARVFKRYGVSVVSLDYPFHGSGPTERKYFNVQDFKKMLFEIIKHYKSAGKPVYLLGHSMGPAVIQELLYDSPDLVQGAIMLSPGGKTSALLLKHYQEQSALGLTQKERGEDAKVNLEGEQWSAAMGRDFKANKAARMKTQRPVLVIAGDHDSWSTPEILEDMVSRYPNASLEIVPDAGHLLFKVRGKTEKLFTERVLSFIEAHEGFTLKKAETRALPDTLRFQYYYENSSMMRAWFTTQHVLLRSCLVDEHVAQGILSRWFFDLKSYLHDLAANKIGILTADTSPLVSRVRIILKLEAAQMTANDMDTLLSYLMGKE